MEPKGRKTKNGKVAMNFNIDERIAMMFDLYVELNWTSKSNAMEQLLFTSMNKWFEENAGDFPPYQSIKTERENIIKNSYKKY